MSSTNPPTITLFNGIDYNSKYFLSQTGYITFQFLDTNYLKKVGTAISNAFTTFNKDTSFKGNILPITTTSDIGSSANPFRTVYTTNIFLSKMGADNLMTISGSTNFQQGLSFGDSTIRLKIL